MRITIFFVVVLGYQNITVKSLKKNKKDDLNKTFFITLLVKYLLFSNTDFDFLKSSSYE